MQFLQSLKDLALGRPPTEAEAVLMDQMRARRTGGARGGGGGGQGSDGGAPAAGAGNGDRDVE